MKLTRKQIGLRPAKSRVYLNANLMTAHYGGESPWGTVDRRTEDSFKKGTNHNRCATIWRAYQAFHMDSRGYADIAYNFGVCPHGVIFEGRGPNTQSGAQMGGINRKTFAWCYIGGAGDPFPIEAQLAVHHETTTEYSLRTTLDHSKWAVTGCAGDHIRNAISEWMANGPPPYTLEITEDAVLFIIKSYDQNNRERYALTDGLYRSEFVSNALLNEVRETLNLETKEVSWDFWTKQLTNIKSTDVSQLPISATTEEIVATVEVIIENLIRALESVVVDGKKTTAEEVRQLLLELLGS